MRREGFISPLACIGEPAESRDAVDTYAPIINSYATIEAFATVDAGTVRSTRIDPDAWIFKHAHIGHDAHVMERAEVSTGAVIGGHAIIGPGAKIGLNATVLPWKVIGARARIGAGAVVTHDVPPGETWAGNPARRMPDKPDVELDDAMRTFGYERKLEDEPSNSSPAHVPITGRTPLRHVISTSPATATAKSTSASDSPASDADELWWEWLASRDTQAKRTTPPIVPPGGFIEPSARPARRSVRSWGVDL